MKRHIWRKSPWHYVGLGSSVVVGVTAAQILRLFPASDVFLGFVGMGALVFAGLVFFSILKRCGFHSYGAAMPPDIKKDVKWHSQWDENYRGVRSAEDRLDELERLKRRDMITTEEYAAKRQEILKDL